MTQEKYNDEQCKYNENECPYINNKHRVNQEDTIRNEKSFYYDYMKKKIVKT